MTVSERPQRGIPTKYSDTQFRSRLEARWGAFFDLIGWSWVYEPFDAEGWIPDFLIEGPKPFLVEVGPVATPAEYWAKGEKARASFPVSTSWWGQSGDQVRLDEYEWHTLVAGVTAGLRPGNYRVYSAGVWAQAPQQLGPGPAEDWRGANAAFWAECAICEGMSLLFDALTTSGPFQGPCGHDSDSGRPAVAGAFLQRLWREAGNRVQWRAPA